MLILALQCCPLDAHMALELVKLIADIEIQTRGAGRDDVEFCLAARKDTPRELVEAAQKNALRAFGKCHVIYCKRHGVGWPVGPNDLWAEIMMRLSIMAKEGKTKATGVLTFEPDCIPLRADWIDIMRETWLGANELRKREAVGHAHDNNHINGNGIFDIRITKNHPEMNGSDPNAGWDAFHGELLCRIGEDTDAIYQLYGLRDYTEEVLSAVRKGGVIPALLHGTKGPEGIRIARRMLNDGKLAEAAKTARPAYSEEKHRIIFQKPLTSASVSVKPMVEPSREDFNAARDAAQAFDKPMPTTEPDVSIFIRTCLKDAAWLDYCLQSLVKRAVGGFREIVVAARLAEAEDIRVIVGKYPVRIVAVDAVCENDYIGQQHTKCCADKWCVGEFIMHWDSDCIALRDFTPGEFFTDGLPMFLYRPWEKAEGAATWREPTSGALGCPAPFETMATHPMIHPRGLLNDFRRYIEILHRVPFAKFMRGLAKFSEFNAIGNFAYLYQRGRYKWIETGDITERLQDGSAKATDGYPRPLKQFHSWGGLTPAIQKEIEAIIAPNDHEDKNG